ncbi:MAG: glycosyltransferase family 39 protein [Oceanicaulis sp.]
MRAALAVAAGLLVLRVVALLFDPNSLYADETQYWLWSLNPDWGYFSKPPLIAWVIALTTGIFGDADWAVRIASPFLHTATATFLGLSAARLFDARTGAVAALIWLTMPAVWLSGQIISTDAVLLVGWSAGLYAVIRLRERPSWAFAIMLGVAAGWAFLAKYATIYFLLGLGLGAIVDAPLRRALISLKGLAAGAIFLALIAGNIAWNAANEFATVSHTAANANWGGPLFRPDELAQFVIDQLGVFGPLTFFALVAAIVTAAREELRGGLAAARPRLMLALFSAPAIVIVAAQAFISRAHANWAASAYAAGTILVASWLMTGPGWRRIVLWVSLGLHAIAGLVLIALAASTPLSDSVGLANAFKRIREWPETADALERVAEEVRADAIAFDNRNDFHQMQRYGEFDAELFMWMRYDHPLNFAEATWPLPAGYEGRVLIASERPEEIEVMRRDFETMQPAGEIAIDLGGGRERRYRLFLAEGYAPAARDAEFEAWVAERRAGD